MPNDKEIHSITADRDYRYLGVLECDPIKHIKIKKIVFQEYKRLVKLLKSRLNSGILIKAIKNVCYTQYDLLYRILNLTKNKLQIIDRITRKPLTIYGVFHLRSDANRLFVDRSLGGRSLKSIFDSVRREEGQLSE